MSTPVDHPAPWRWEEIGGVFSLRDARGVRILLGDERRGVHPDDRVAEVLLAAAPTLPDLVLRLVHELDTCDTDHDVGLSAEAHAALDRIDEARRG